MYASTLTTPALINAEALRAAGRLPTVPFRIALADGEVLVMQRLLRVLPGKRIVGEAEFRGQKVLAKLFVSTASDRHWQKECSGLEALHSAGVPTPKLCANSRLAEGGHALLTAYYADAESLLAAWNRVRNCPVGDSAALSVLSPALTMLACMHRAGLAQEDLHLGNFLRAGDELLVIDGDSVRNFGQPLTAAQAAANIGMLLAQLPAVWDEMQAALLMVYRAAGGSEVDDAALQSEIERVRNWRLKDFLSKCVRDCSLFAVSRTSTRFSSVRRDSVGRLKALLDDPDRMLEEGVRLKSGNTCTVAQVALGEAEAVIKRYNLKSVGHALSRLWRPSRAWHSWREAHRLQLYGIATPMPLALIEERLGPLRRRAWLVTDHCPGDSLASHLSADREPPEAEASAIVSLFTTLHRLRISHGDLKATNLLWYAGEIWLIDLDACTQHRSDAAYRQAWRRDRARLLRNWPESSVLGGWLQANLPPV